MGIGQMRERVSIEAESLADDGMGGSVRSYEAVAVVWAKVKPLKGGEKLFAAQVEARQAYHVTIRYRDDVNTTQRLVWRGNVMNIKAVANTDMHQRFLILECEAGVAA